MSYASEDYNKVKLFYEPLKRIGFNPWMDKVDILPGAEWELEIRKKLNESDYFLAFLSNNSINKKGYVQKELRLAFETMQLFLIGQIFLIPVLLEKVELPERLSKIQYIKCTGTNGLSIFIENMLKIKKEKISYINPADTQKFLEEEMIEIQRTVRSLAKDIIDDQKNASGRNELTKEKINFIIKSLNEAGKVEFLYLYETRFGRFKGKPFAGITQTLELKYLNKKSELCVHLVDMTYDPMYELRCRYGLGDDSYHRKRCIFRNYFKIK